MSNPNMKLRYTHLDLALNLKGNKSKSMNSTKVEEVEYLRVKMVCCPKKKRRWCEKDCYFGQN